MTSVSQSVARRYAARSATPDRCIGKSVAFVLALALLAGCSSQPADQAPLRPEKELWTQLIPRPVEAIAGADTFTLREDASITLAPTEIYVEPIGEMLALTLRRSTGYALPFGMSSEGDIRLELEPGMTELGNEGYELTVAAEYVSIRAATGAGLFYGTQTFRQLMPSRVELDTKQTGPWRVATGTIRDTPRFAWRGLMIDIARHFFTVDEVRRYIDAMAYYKMNRLHLHLTDDQGWRIEINAWPSLTTIGGATEVGGGPGGFYTKEDYTELVQYAAARFVTVVPELDMPGHTRAALASVPELNCDGQSPAPYTGTSVGISSLCIGLPITESFVRDVIGEVAAMTPGPFLHVGGDEAKKTTDADYLSFMSMVRDVVESNGKQFVGWEEVARIELGPNDIAQHWLDEEPAIMASTKGAQILLSPATRTYLDMKYALSSPPNTGTAWAGFIDVPTAYDWDPGTWLVGVPESRIAGLEAPAWTETIATTDDLDALTFPRLLGYAELGWSPSVGRDVDAYLKRLGVHGPRLEAMGLEFYAAPQVPWTQR